uniref:HAT C-terminal dimerisation domain-containing protein n=1 Tax=Cajanus cajan TaxID=3821 RepID=A0A151RVJ3_CAJCA|nr:hypothetical protein KK1_031801 [Cajanus cajan]
MLRMFTKGKGLIRPWKTSKFETLQKGRKIKVRFLKRLFSLDDAKECRKVMFPVEWWEMFRDHCSELKRFVIRFLSLTCSSSRSEYNWSSFEHTKRRNCFHQTKMNDLVYVMYNLKLKIKVIRKFVTLPFDDIQSDDEWITEEGDNV